MLDQNTDTAEGLMYIHVNIKKRPVYQKITIKYPLTKLYWVFTFDWTKNIKRLWMNKSIKEIWGG